MGQLVKVNARLIDKKTEKPLVGGTLKAFLWDRDIVVDDFLAESHIGVNGEVSFIFDLNNACSLDSPMEDEPDLYIVVMNPKDTAVKRVFSYRKSEMFKDVDFLDRDPVTKMMDELTKDLGDISI